MTLRDYDIRSRLIQQTAPDPDGVGPLTAPMTQWAYDAASQLTTVTDPLGRVTSQQYDSLGRVTTTTLPDPDGAGPLAAPIQSWEYDVLGNVVSMVDPLGNATAYTFDNLSRKISATHADPDGSGPLAAPITQSAYDLAGRVTSITDALGNTTEWAYDGLGRTTSETNELNDSRNWIYDAAGNVTELTNRKGHETQFQHDNIGRILTERWIASNGSTVLNAIQYTWDAASRLASLSDNDSAYAYSYDNLGRVTSVDNNGTPNSPAVVLASEYDAVGHRTNLTATIDGIDDFENQWTYDAAGRMTSVRQAAQSGGNGVAEKRVDFAYTTSGQFDTLTRFADASGTALVAETNYGYDQTNRLTSLTHAQGTTVLADYAWTFDANNRLTTTTSPDGTIDYEYDAGGQLLTADYTFQADESYSYDENGNRTGGGYSTGTNNRLLSDGTFDYQYDADGNRTRKTNIATEDDVEYEWDHRNRLASVTFRTSTGIVTRRILYTYDAFNQRLSRQLDSDGDGTIDSVENYVYDDTDIALVFSDSGTLTERLLYGPATDQPLATENTSGEVRWHVADNQGTIRDVAEYDSTTGATSVVNHLRYNTYGTIVAQSDSAEQPRHTYTGREWDADTELYFYRARWYDPAVGRFISEDPIGFYGGDGNVARYVGNNPVSVIDPGGLTRNQAAIPYPPPLDLTQRPDLQAFMASMHVFGTGKRHQDWLDLSANYAAGIGDSLTFGGTDHLRDYYDINGGIDHNSTAYIAGEATEVAVEILVSGGGAAMRHSATRLGPRALAKMAKSARTPATNSLKTRLGVKSLMPNKVHHVNTLVGHPAITGGRGPAKSLFPTIVLPRWLHNHRRNLRIVNDAKHAMLQRRARYAELLVYAGGHQLLTGGRFVLNFRRYTESDTETPPPPNDTTLLGSQ